MNGFRWIKRQIWVCVSFSLTHTHRRTTSSSLARVSMQNISYMISSSILETRFSDCSDLVATAFPGDDVCHVQSWQKCNRHNRCEPSTLQWPPSYSERIQCPGHLAITDGCHQSSSASQQGASRPQLGMRSSARSTLYEAGQKAGDPLWELKNASGAEVHFRPCPWQYLIFRKRGKDVLRAREQALVEISYNLIFCME